MRISLENSLSHIEVNSNGAYIDNFEVKGKSIFFPKVMVKIGDKLKVRGGMHVCAPNFGEDEILHDLANHGFARDLNWNVDDYGKDYVSLSLDGIKFYKDIRFYLDYRLDGSSLIAKLKVINKSGSKVLLAPGFYPYFYADHKPIVINNKDIEKSKLCDGIIDGDRSQRFVTDGNDIVIEGIENINEYVFWSDFKGDYLCVEPTYRSIAFKDDSRLPHKLDIGEKFIQKIKINVNLQSFY